MALSDSLDWRVAPLCRLEFPPSEGHGAGPLGDPPHWRASTLSAPRKRRDRGLFSPVGPRGPPIAPTAKRKSGMTLRRGKTLSARAPRRSKGTKL